MAVTGPFRLALVRAHARIPDMQTQHNLFAHITAADTNTRHGNKAVRKPKTSHYNRARLKQVDYLHKLFLFTKNRNLYVYKCGFKNM